jgi:peptide/nickel transport system substrate-binding protein
VSPVGVGNDFVTNSLGLEQLLRLDSHLRVHPWLATSWQRTNPVTYVYQLRHGVKFWDGTEMTAADVAASLNAARSPKVYASVYYVPVKSIKATGRYTVTVTLKKPDNSWADIPALYGWVFEKSFYLAHKTTMGKPGVLIVGTGPWKYDSLDPTSGIELSANPHYWGGPVPIQHISFKYFKDSTSLALAMRAGEIDLNPQLINGVKGFMAAAGSNVQLIGQGDRCGMGLLVLNPHYGPWTNLHVRRAVAYALNREDIVAAQGAPDTEPLYTMVTPDQWRELGTAAQTNPVVKTIPTYPFSLAKAKQELAQSPYPHGFSASVDTTSPYGVGDVMQAISGDLAKIGIKLKITIVSDATWLAKFEVPHSKEGMTFYSLGCYYPDAGQFPNLGLSFNSVKGSYPWSVFRYLNPTIARLVATANTTTDNMKRIQLYGQILRLEAQDLAYLPLTTEAYFGAINKKYSFPDFGWFGGDYWPWALAIKPA